MKYGDMYVNSDSISMQQQSKYTFRLNIMFVYIVHLYAIIVTMDWTIFFFFFGTQMVIVISNDVTVKNIC